jgi:hypothetical protein
MSITVLLNDDSEKISCDPVMDILFVLCLFNADFSYQAYDFGHWEEKLLLYLSILSCFNSNKVCILYNQRDATYTTFFIIIKALHFSSGFSAHHQEIIKCLCNLGYCHSSTPAVDSRKA